MTSIKNYFPAHIFIFTLLFLLPPVILNAKLNKEPFSLDTLACPVTAIAFPSSVSVDHDSTTINSIIFSKASTRWISKGKLHPISVFFNKGTIVRRFSLSLLNNQKDTNSIVTLKWFPLESHWGCQIRDFLVPCNNKISCYFLDINVEIPGNIPASRIDIYLDENISLSSLCFSSEPNERPSSTCPVPLIIEKMNKVYNECIKNPNNQSNDSEFVSLFKLLLYRYDCKRDYDFKPVPAWWLINSEDPEKWINFLAGMKYKPGRILFGSKLFRETLDGAIAETYYDSSIAVGKELSKKKSK